jgi:ABC-type phosphate/phosphonate transport system substrate-binding protein
MIPDLITARAILDGVREGRFEVGPLDAYWHWLIARHAPELTAGIRVLESTDVAPMPAFVATEGTPGDVVSRLKSAFAAASRQPWFGAVAEGLGLLGFAPVSHDSFDLTVQRHAAAVAAGYPTPA